MSANCNSCIYHGYNGCTYQGSTPSECYQELLIERAPLSPEGRTMLEDEMVTLHKLHDRVDLMSIDERDNKVSDYLSQALSALEDAALYFQSALDEGIVMQ